MYSNESTYRGRQPASRVNQRSINGGTVTSDKNSITQHSLPDFPAYKTLDSADIKAREDAGELSHFLHHSVDIHCRIPQLFKLWMIYLLNVM